MSQSHKQFAYKQMGKHEGHEIVGASYANRQNLAIECETCWECIVDADDHEPNYDELDHVGHDLECYINPTHAGVYCHSCDETVLEIEKP